MSQEVQIQFRTSPGGHLDPVFCFRTMYNLINPMQCNASSINVSDTYFKKHNYFPWSKQIDKLQKCKLLEF